MLFTAIYSFIEWETPSTEVNIAWAAEFVTFKLLSVPWQTQKEKKLCKEKIFHKISLFKNDQLPCIINEWRK